MSRSQDVHPEKSLKFHIEMGQLETLTNLPDTNVTVLTATDLMLPLPELSLDKVVALASCSGSQSSKVPSFLPASPCRRYCSPWARPRLLVPLRRLLPLLVLLLLDLLTELFMNVNHQHSVFNIHYLRFPESFLERLE